MKFPFNTSEQLIFDFEEILKGLGLTITSGSDLERLSFVVMETSAKYKKELNHNNAIDIRRDISEMSGLIDIIRKIVKHRYHPNFSELIPHLKLLNQRTGSTALTYPSKVSDDGNNKLFELYIALLCMEFATNIRLDNPNSSKGDNPDVIFTYGDKTWAIACKALHSAKEKTLFDNVEKGVEQINRSSVDRGIVVVNLKNVIDFDKFWPIVNMTEADDIIEPEFGCHINIETPIRFLQNFGSAYQQKLIDLIGIEQLNALSDSEKCTSSFVIFLHGVTSVLIEGVPQITLLKTLNLIKFSEIEEEYELLINSLNNAMHK